MSATATPCSPRFTGRTRLAILLALLAGACGADPAQAPVPLFPETSTVGHAHGARLVADPAAEVPVRTGGLVAEAERSIEVGAIVWGADVTVLEGWTIAFQGGRFACQSRPTSPRAAGCTHREQGWIQAGPDGGCRTSALVHEIGHVLIGDTGHLDARWALAALHGQDACRP